MFRWMQKLAFKTQEIWYKLYDEENRKNLEQSIGHIWENNYYTSLNNMKNVVNDLNDKNYDYYINCIVDIAEDIVKTRIDMCDSIGKNIDQVSIQYDQATILLNNENYDEGFDGLINTYMRCNDILEGNNIKIIIKPNKTLNNNFETNYLVILPLIILPLIVMIKKTKKR